MNTSQHLKQQLLYSYNAEQTVVFPIDWKNLLHTNRPPQSPQAVREYLNNVIERMNQHFAVVMHGPMTGKIMVTRESRAPDAQPESIFVSVWRARSLFPRKIQLRWAENGQSRTLFKPALDVWLRSSARREIIPGAVKSPAHPVVKWLRALLSPPDEVSLLLFRGLNARAPMLQSFYRSVQMPEQWPAKRFWQSFYRIVPLSRPAKYSRVKLRGVDCVYLPSREEMLQNLSLFERQSALGYVTF